MSRAPCFGPIAVTVLAISLGLVHQPDSSATDQRPTPNKGAEIDATTLRHKVLCGYQGWFRCPGDPAGEGWKHWSRNTKKIAPDTLTFEMWPDLTEFNDDEK